MKLLSMMCLMLLFFFFFNDTATTEIYTYCHTLSLHDALPIWGCRRRARWCWRRSSRCRTASAACSCSGPAHGEPTRHRSEEHTSELQSLMRISYAVFCLKKKNNNYEHLTIYNKPDKTRPHPSTLCTTNIY